MTPDPQPNTPTTDDDATNEGRSASAPAEGGDDVSAPNSGSPAG